MISVFEGVDSKVIGTNLRKEKLLDFNKYTGKNGFKTAIKLYYELSKPELQEYHSFQNEIKTKYDGTIFKFSSPVIYEGKEYNFAKINFLKLEDDFITPEKLKNKLDKKIFSKLIKEINFSKYKICSIQNYVNGVNIGNYISGGFNSLGLFLEEDKLNSEIKKLSQLDNFQDGFINIILELNEKILPFVKTSNSGFVLDNFKIIGQKDNVLEVMITDIGGNIKDLLSNF